MNRLNKGFSLIEIMVGMVIGMISMLVIAQVFTVFEGQKRTTTGGADAQTNGAIGLYMIERGAKMAGWGLSASLYASCQGGQTYTYCDGSAACGGTAGPLSGFSFMAVRLADGGTDPDSVNIQFFADPNLDTFKLPATTTLTGTMPQSSAELDVGSVSGCAEGGMVLVASGDGNCTLMQITQVQGTALKLQHNPGGSGGIYNPTINYQKDNSWPAYSQGAQLSCMDKPPNAFYETYSIDSAERQLLKTDQTTANEPMMAGIMDLQAQYGIAPAGSQQVDQWVDATGGTWSNPTATNDWKRIKAVRIALVARSGQYEKPDDSGNCTATTATTGWSSWATFDTTNYPADWKCYRYKTFETIVPLRNVIWANI